MVSIVPAHILKNLASKLSLSICCHCIVSHVLSVGRFSLFSLENDCYEYSIFYFRVETRLHKMEYKTLKYQTKDKQKYESKLRYINGYPSNQIMNKPNQLYLNLLGQTQSFKKKMSYVPQKITTLKYVRKRDNAKIESDAWEYIDKAPITDGIKYDIDSEYVFNPEYTQPLSTVRSTLINTDNFTTNLINMRDQKGYNILNTNSNAELNFKYQLKDILYCR